MNTTLRLTKILELLHKSDETTPIPTKRILNHLHNKVDIRTVQRDIKKLRDDFIVPIENIKNRGYYLSNSSKFDWSKNQSLIRFLEMEATVSQLKDTFSKNKSELIYIDLEKNELFKGLEHITPCLIAIKKQKELKFSYKKHGSSDIQAYTIKPYLLKEYQNRWYIIGIPSGLETVRTFGLDRIVTLEISAISFHRKHDLQPEVAFKNIIGLNYSNQKTQKVLLKFTKKQGDYIKTLPLHSSQEIVHETTTEMLVKIEVLPNYELKQLLLFYTPNVEIIEPKWLRDEVVNDLKIGLKNYE